MEATALSIAKSVLDGVLTKAKSAIADEVALQLGVQRELAFIKDEFEMMQTFLETAHEEKGQSKVVRTWVKQVRDLAYDVEDCLQDFSVHLVKPSPWRLPWTLKTRHRIANEIKELKARVEDVSQRNLRYRLIKDKDSASKSIAAAEQSALSGLAAFGTEEAQQANVSKVDLKQLISHGDKALGVISVWGRSDAGMSSIIKEVYGSPETIREFQCRAWVKLMHPFDPNDFVQSLMRQFYASSAKVLLGKIEEGTTVEFVDILKKMEMRGQNHDLVEEFVSHVNEKKYLIVLNDLSTMAEWDLIKTYLPDKNNGSRVVVTTQQVEIARLCIEQQHEVSEVKHLSYDLPLYLFFKKDSLPIGSGLTKSGSTVTNSTAGPSSSVLSTVIEEHISTTLEVNESNVLDPQVEKNPNLSIGKYLRSRTMFAALEQNNLIGRKMDKAEVIRLISEDHEQRQVISVWGMGGIGKTTLVKNVYKSQELRSKFQTRAWVTVLHPLNREDFLKGLIIQLDAHSTERKEKTRISMLGGGGIQQELAMMGINKLIEKKNELINEKKYLIVLDDLSSITEWKLIKEDLPNKNDGSRIVVTTRNANVAKYCSQEQKYVHHLKSLTEKASFDLFRQKVFKENQSTVNLSPGMIEQAKLILKKCDGLPLAIATIGGFLATIPKTIIEWRKLHEHINLELEINPSLGEIKTVLNSSYDGLPYNLKSCFLYLSIFPEDYNIRRRRLVGRWIAEGYTKEMRGINTDENGEHNFTELMNRGMIQPSKTRISNSGRIDFCQVHDLMREISISKATEENLVFTLDENCNSNSQDKVRHLAISSSWCRDKNMLESMTDFSLIRSLTVFGEWQPFFISDKMKLLRVLDLEDTSGLRDYHLEQVGKFYHLKYFSVRGSRIFHLPDSLGNLRHLETLDIRDTFVTQLPTTIVRLRKLQYLRAGSVQDNEDDIREDFLPDDCTGPVRNVKYLRWFLLATCIALCRPETFEIEEYDRWERSQFMSVIFGILFKHVDVAGVKVPRGIGKMKALHTLGVVNVTTGTNVLKEIRELTRLRKLGVTGINKKNNAEFCSAISAHGHLQSLFVRSIGEQGFLGCLENVSPPPKQLESLKLYGNLVKLPDWIENLHSLVKLCLRSTQLKQDAVLVLEQLPNLVFLFLREKSFDIEELSFRQGTFKTLEVLELEKLDNLKSVLFEETAMPKLELLQFVDCNYLKDNGFSGVQTLKSLKDVSVKGVHVRKALIENLQVQLAQNPNQPNCKVE